MKVPRFRRARILGILAALALLGSLPVIARFGRPSAEGSGVGQSAELVAEARELERLGDYAAAELAYRSAARTDPRSVETQLRWYHLLVRMGGEHEAWERFHTLHRENPREPVFAFLHAFALQRQTGNRQLVEEAYEQAIALDPESPWPLAYRYLGGGRTLSEVDRSEALASLPRCIHIAPRNPAFHHARGRVLLASGLPEAALSSFREALDTGWDWWNRTEVHADVVSAHLELGQSEEAESAARRGLLEFAARQDWISVVRLAEDLRRGTSKRGLGNDTRNLAVTRIRGLAEYHITGLCDRAQGSLELACLTVLEEHLRFQGRHAEALTTSHLALEALRIDEAPLLVAQFITSRCQSSLALGHFLEALEDCREANGIYIQHGAHLAALAPLGGQIDAHLALGELEPAWQAARSFLQLSREHGDEDHLIAALAKHGWIAWRIGDRRTAIASLARLERLVDRTGKGAYEAARFRAALGDYRGALRYYRVAAADTSSPGGRLSVSLRGLDGLARTYLTLGDESMAHHYATAYFDRYLSFSDPFHLPVPNLSEVLLAQGREDDAIRAAGHLLRIAKAGDSPGLIAMARAEVARMELIAGRYEGALQDLEELLGELQSLGLFWQRQEALLALARAYVESGHYEEAASILTDAQTHLEVTRNPEARWRLAHLEGRLLEHQGRPGSALLSYQRAIEVLEELRRGAPSGEFRSRYMTGRLDPYEAALKIRLEGPPGSRDIAAAFRLSEAKKARALRDRTGGVRPSVEAVATAIAPDQALIEYVFVRDTLWAIVVRHDGQEARRLPIARSRLDDQIERLRMPLVQLAAGEISITQTEWDIDAAHDLYRGLIAPLEDRLRGVRTLLVVPEDELWLVPFEALVTERAVRPRPEDRVLFDEYHRHDFLIDRYAVAYLPGAEWMLPGAPGRSPADGGILSVGDPSSTLDGDGLSPIPASAKEARAVAGIHPGSMVLVGPSATESRLRELAPGYRVLHIAAHAVVDPVSPASSGLILASDEASDGFASALEISGWSLSADLVTLSGCRTASGPIRSGEGVMALSRSFLQAGARTVVATQWAIPDEAGGLMPDFYQSLILGRSPPVSLRQAKLDFRLSRTRLPGGRVVSRAHPLYWAGFILIGRPSLRLSRQADLASRSGPGS